MDTFNRIMLALASAVLSLFFIIGVYMYLALGLQELFQVPFVHITFVITLLVGWGYFNMYVLENDKDRKKRWLKTWLIVTAAYFVEFVTCAVIYQNYYL